MLGMYVAAQDNPYTYSYGENAAAALLPLYQAQPALDPFASSPNRGNLFDYTLTNLLSQREIMPRQVDEAVQSLNRPVEFGFACPMGAPYQQVQIRITTTHSPARDHQLTYYDSGYAGKYWWVPKPVSRGSTRLIYFDNVLQLSARAFINPQDEMQHLNNMGLLYHELLHGQLMIDAIKQNPATRAQLCSNQAPDVSAADMEHRVVTPYEHAFLLRYSQQREKLLEVRVPKGHPQFRLRIGTVRGFSQASQIAMRIANGGYANNFVYPPRLELVNNELHMVGAVRDPSRDTVFVATFARAHP